MALVLGDNFSYGGAKPLDARLKYSTLADMKAVVDATMYEGCEAYCVETDKYYKFLSSNTVDEDTGKWRERQSGGGADYTAGDGIDITDDTISIDPMPSEDMDEVIDELPTGGNIAVTGYVPLGTLIPYYGETAPDFFLACDGSTYNKSDYPELANHLLSLTNNTPYIVDGDNTKFKVPDLRGQFLRGTGTNSDTDEGSGSAVGVRQKATEHQRTMKGTSSNSRFTLYKNADENTDIQYADKGLYPTSNGFYFDATAYTVSGTVTAKYTSRPTNTSVLFCIAYKDIYSNPMNDYSTDEKVVGTWIDGKTLYQRTMKITDLSAISSTTRGWYLVYSDSVTKYGIVKVDFGSTFVEVSSNGVTYISPINEYISESSSPVMYSSIRPDINDTTHALYIRVLNSGASQLRATGAILYVTIQYTKI